MKLAHYMNRHRLTDAAIAERSGVPLGSVGYYRRGERIPRPRHMLAIYSATGGAVTADDFYDLEREG
jgi:transcriptional regulator with XRE-family HTH domain